MLLVQVKFSKGVYCEKYLTQKNNLLSNCALNFCRSLSEVYTNKKSSLKFLIECFPRVPPRGSCGEDALTVMMALPATNSLGLTHEQVMPFLKKMENGQQREGTEFQCYLACIYVLLLCAAGRYFESVTRSHGNFSALSGHFETFCGKDLSLVNNLMTNTFRCYYYCSTNHHYTFGNYNA